MSDRKFQVIIDTADAGEHEAVNSVSAARRAMVANNIKNASMVEVQWQEKDGEELVWRERFYWNCKLTSVGLITYSHSS